MFAKLRTRKVIQGVQRELDTILTESRVEEVEANNAH
jgi:hypothetical protein